MSDAQQACAQGEPVPTGRYEIRGIVAKGNECLWAADLGITPEVYGLYTEVRYGDGVCLRRWVADYPTYAKALTAMLALTTESSYWAFRRHDGLSR